MARSLLEESYGHAVLRQPRGECQAHRAGADDRDLGLAGGLAIR